MPRKYSLTFIKVIQTKTFLNRISSDFTEIQIVDAILQIGQNLYQFQTDDGIDEKTLIKTQKQVIKFLKWYCSLFNKQLLKLENLPVGYLFTHIQQINAFKHLQSFKFMELNNEEIFHYKATKLERKRNFSRWCNFFSICSSHVWEQCIVLITSHGILQKIEGKAEQFLLFDTNFQIEYGLKKTNQILSILLKTNHRKIQLKANNYMEYIIFLYYLQKILSLSKQSEIRYEASSFVRNYNNIDFIVDAENYFKIVAEQFLKAQSEIYICGWWVSPELPLIRSQNNHQEINKRYRLDQILKRQAQKGVHIYIIVFNQPLILPNNSEYTLSVFSKLHSNIKIQQHPSNILPTFWSHHEKIVVVDQKVAFLGGIDLCYGRYDSHQHPLGNSQALYPGIQYNNVRIKDFRNVYNYKKDALSRNQQRMPWHDVSLRLEGTAVADICNHFISYWNHCEIQNMVVRQLEKQLYKSEKDMAELISPCTVTSQQKWTENINLSEADKITVQKFEEIAKKRDKINSVILRAKVDELQKKPSYKRTLTLHYKTMGLFKPHHIKWYLKTKKFEESCQLLRSASSWSIGLKDKKLEKSIQNAYIQIILNAKRYIYIQNQFFISSTEPQNSSVQNTIAYALYTRIKKAIERNQRFKAIIFIPLMPGFEGQIDQSVSMTLRLLIHWQYLTISRGQKSIYFKLKKLTPHPQDYLEFYSLRQHGLLNDKPVTEIIYIHSKLIIVDDEIAICGSANINDRSQLGNRDSQVALIINSNNTKKQKNRKIKNLRIQLYCEHFGLSQKESQDPLDLQLQKKIRIRASCNTRIYRDIFGCYPDDNIHLLIQTNQFRKYPSKQLYLKLSKSIIGHVVQFPLCYLMEQTLSFFEPAFIHNVVV